MKKLMQLLKILTPALLVFTLISTILSESLIPEASSILFWIPFVLFIISAAGLIYFSIRTKDKKLRKNLTSILNLFLITAASVLVYLLFLKFPISIDLTEGSLYTLTPKTKEVIKDLDFKINVIVFQDENTPNLKLRHWGARIFNRIKNLLQEYKRLNPLIEVNYVNPFENQAMTKNYQIKGIGDIIIDSKKGRWYVKKEDMAKWNFRRGMTGQFERFIEFYKVEEKLTSTLLSLKEQIKPVIAWLEGDGEVIISSAERGGASLLKNDLEANNFIVKTVSSLKKIPDDATLLVIAGPQKRIPDEMLREIDAFISKGKIIILLKDYIFEETLIGIENLIKKHYGIILNNKIVLDNNQFYAKVFNVIPDYSFHQIVRVLREKKLPVIFPVANYFLLPKDKKNIHVLLKASSSAWIEGDPKKLLKTGEPSGRKIKEKDIVLSLIAENKKNKSKIMLVSDADFIRDGNIGIAGNKDFFLNAVNYLLKRLTPLSISRPIEKERRVILSNNWKKFFFYFFVIIIPLAIIIIGILIGLKRRKLKTLGGEK